MMQILMDIDGTIARQNDTQFVQLLWQTLGLSSEALPQVLSMADALNLPQVRAARSRMGEKRFRMCVSMLQQSESAIASRLIIPGAQEALQRLAQFGEFYYCTARKATYSGQNAASSQAIAALNTRMQRATYAWLTQHNFPYTDRVIFCSGPRGKLETIATRIHENNHVILVDNESHALVKALADLPQELQAQIIAHTTVLVFGQDGSLPLSRASGLRCFALSGWDQLDDVFGVSVEVERDNQLWKSPTTFRKM